MNAKLIANVPTIRLASVMNAKILVLDNAEQVREFAFKFCTDFAYQYNDKLSQFY